MLVGQVRRLVSKGYMKTITDYVLIIFLCVSVVILCFVLWKYSGDALYNRITLVEKHVDILAHTYQNLQYQVDVECKN